MNDLAESVRAMRGCDHSNGTYYCAAVPAPYTDEVSGEVFCAEHAGPLAWPDRMVNLYSAALRIGAYCDAPIRVPGVASEERAA